MAICPRMTTRENPIKFWSICPPRQYAVFNFAGLRHVPPPARSAAHRRDAETQSPRDPKAPPGFRDGYFSIQYSISYCASLKFALGLAVPVFRTVPWIPKSLPVPPVIRATDTVLSFPDPVFWARVVPREKNFSPFSS